MTNQELWFYDFERDEVIQLSSKSLFAGDGLLTKQGELRFKQLIEDPLIQLRETVLKNPSINQFDWKVFRASLLYFMGQTHRFQVAIAGSDTDGKLETFLQKDETYFDQLALAAQQKYMKEKRARSKQLTADFLKMKGLVDQMYAIAGLTVDEGLAAYETP